MTDVATAGAATALQLQDWYLLMLRIRYTEKAAYDLFMGGFVKGTTHLANGHEAVAVGASTALRDDDYVWATYRGHHHAISRGLSLEACLAELMSKRTGSSRGKGGSMHLTHAAGNMMGSYAIIGSHIAMSVGAAWSSVLRGSSQVSVAFFGDGATNIGAFHEALNLAAVWKLPALFICENNLYMEYTLTSTVTSVPHPAADRAAAYGLERIIVDGNDAEAVHDAVAAAARRARAGEGPSIIECLTYRHHGHSRADPAKYRPQGELDEWLARDPVTILRTRLTDAGVSESEIEAIESAARHEVDQAIEAAKAAPPADPADAFTDVWADEETTWRT
jgi:acetoin:2,6-dichlorophenolindophenol oxidoreductase subunit alpha